MQGFFSYLIEGAIPQTAHRVLRFFIINLAWFFAS